MGRGIPGKRKNKYNVTCGEAAVLMAITEPQSGRRVGGILSWQRQVTAWAGLHKDPCVPGKEAWLLY